MKEYLVIVVNRCIFALQTSIMIQSLFNRYGAASRGNQSSHSTAFPCGGVCRRGPIFLTAKSFRHANAESFPNPFSSYS